MARTENHSAARAAVLAAPLLLGLLLVSGCDTSARSFGPQVRDSAGVRIVENTSQQWPEGGGWRLAGEPLLDIGVLEGDPEYQLYRVSTAVKLSDGRIVVANTGTSELRYFDRAEKFLGSAGRKGGGPGEFESMGGIWALDGDSILAFDWRQRRVSIFGPDGGFVRSFTLHSGDLTSPIPVGLTAGRSLIVKQGASYGTEITTGVTRDSTYYGRFDLDGVLTDTIGRFPGDELYFKADEHRILVTGIAFGRSPVSAVFGDGFYFGDSESYEIAYYAADGTLERSVRVARQNLPVTRQDIERYKRDRIERARDESRRQLEQMLLADMPFPETMPAYEGMMVDAEGNVWVEDYRRPGDDQPRWTVFDEDGVMLGVIETPPKFRLYEIGPDYVLGRWTDELDVEHIRIYELIKN